LYDEVWIPCTHTYDTTATAHTRALGPCGRGALPLLPFNDLGCGFCGDLLLLSPLAGDRLRPPSTTVQLTHKKSYKKSPANPTNKINSYKKSPGHRPTNMVVMRRTCGGCPHQHHTHSARTAIPPRPASAAPILAASRQRPVAPGAAPRAPLWSSAARIST
jgi:hypothetical protein